ncbi:hypothetical protein VTO42DRAFT_1739 [Malbranchea cinnamomea]
MFFTPLLALAALASLPEGAWGAQRQSAREYFRRAGYLDCPETCEVAGPDPANWTSFHDHKLFLSCKRKPKVFQLALHTPIDRSNTNNPVRACSSVADEMVVAQEAIQVVPDPSDLVNASSLRPTNLDTLSEEARNFGLNHRCDSQSVLKTIQEPELGWNGSRSNKRGPRGQALGATRALQSHLLHGIDACESTSTAIFAHYGKTVVGMYAGARFQNQGIAGTLLNQFVEHIRKEGMPTSLTMQLCGGKDRTADFVFGIMADTTPGIRGLTNVQRAVAAWSNATCVDNFDETVSIGNVTLAVTPRPSAKPTTQNTPDSVSRKREEQSESSAVLLDPRAECRTTEVLPGEGCWAVAERCGISQSDLETYNGGGDFCSTLQAYQLVCCSSGTLPSNDPEPNPDGTCKTEQVVSGDSCGTLAARCGITGAKFEEYNNDVPNLCSTLAVGQYVCCTPGELPDMRPKPNPDGSCATYYVVSGDSCSQIAAAHGLKVDDIEDFNEETWGFTGCNNLMAEMTICLSEGSPPMPAPISNAICGPQVRGTARPDDTSRESLAKLNPCPLNVCCNIWGQCGTTEDFCTVTSDRPGEAKPGTNGCISNCGKEIVNNDKGPDSVRHIAYFEAFNGDRKCLYMDVTEVDTSYYTHIHFAFVDITPEWGVSLGNLEEQFRKFKRMTGIKRIAAFGGWTASTHPSTFYLFREGVRPENRETLASNLAAFILANDLDGIDIDWEYPAAPDIPDIPPADPMDGEHYLEFLRLLRQKLPNKSIAIAAPASYWYLRGFPIAEISEVVDYIVYMTYDLHGQWDYNSPWSQSGCLNGDCLRSHVNWTETHNALVMITKAGVPSYKINVGVASYGRSFKAVEPGCYGPMCRYVGEESAAAPGRCTGERGYVSNAEINEIMVKKANAQWWRDEDSDSDIIVYDDTEWVAFMNDQNRWARTNKYLALNFGGTSDWAVDLKRFSPEEGGTDDPQPIEEGAWKHIPCTLPAVEAVDMDSRKRWTESGAAAAWDELKKAWKNRPSDKKNMEFTIFAGYYYRGGEEMRCGDVIDDNGCKDTWLCRDFEGIDNTGPGAYLLYNAFAHLSKWLWNNYEACDRASNSISAASFAEAFAHKDRKDDDFLEFMIINALTVGFTMGLAPIFNNVMKKVIKGSVRDNLKDTSYVLISVGATQTKEIMQHIQTDDQADAYVERALKTAAKGLKEAITLLGEGIFRGDDESLEFLDKALQDGKLLKTLSPGSAIDLENKWIAALHGIMISHTWEMVGITPVVIDTEADCDEEGVGVGDYITSSLAEYSKGCVDGRLYYLVDPDGSPRWTDGIGNWFDSWYSEPNGLRTIYNGDWLGLTVQDMIESAVRYTKKYGNRQKLDEGRDPKFEDTWDQVWEILDGNMVRAPGVIDIPVCKEPEARNNWKFHFGDSKPRYYAYPCNKEDD